MTFRLGSSLLLSISLIVSGCALPRGAALQSEIISNEDLENAQFAVYPVTKSLLPRFEKWPRTGNVSRYSWVGKRNGPIGRVILPGDSISMSIWDSDANSLLTSPEQKVAQLQVARLSA